MTTEVSHSPLPLISEMASRARYLGYMTRDTAKCLNFFSHTKSHHTATHAEIIEGATRTISLFSVPDFSSACETTCQQFVQTVQLLGSRSSLKDKAHSIGELVLEIFGLLEAGSRVITLGHDWNLYKINEPAVDAFNAFCDLPGLIKEVGEEGSIIAEASDSTEEKRAQIASSWLKIAKNAAYIAMDLLTLISIPLVFITSASLFLFLSSVTWITKGISEGIDREIARVERKRFQIDRSTSIS